MKYLAYSKKNKKEAGFTLVEMLVSVAVFSVIVSILSNSFVWGIQSQRYSLARQEILNELNYTMERVSRSLVMAKKDDIAGNNCLAGNKINYEFSGGCLGFKDSSGVCRDYCLDNGVLKEYENGVFFGNLTSSNVNISNFKVNLSGVGQGDDLQPRVTIMLEAESAIAGSADNVKLKLQTTISQRDPDIKRF